MTLRWKVRGREVVGRWRGKVHLSEACEGWWQWEDRKRLDRHVRSILVPKVFHVKKDILLQFFSKILTGTD